MNFHHLGLAVKNPDRAMKFLEGLGFRMGESVLDEQQNVNLVMCKHEAMPDIELIWQAASPGPLDTLLRNFTEFIYHICYSCNDLGHTLEMIASETRIITISRPKPAVLFSNASVSFYKVAGFGLVEIIENKKGVV